MQPRKLERWHGREMITSSLACERVVYEPALSPEETIYEGDGMAVSVDDAMHTYNCLRGVAADALPPKSNVLPIPRSMADSLRPARDQQQQQHVDVPSRGQQGGEGVMPTSSSSSAASGTPTALVPVSSEALGLATTSKQQQQLSRWGAADLVASKLSEAAAAASSAALQPLASAAAAASTAAAAASSAALQPLASASSAALQPLASAAGSLYASSRSLMAYLPGIDKLTAAAISNQILDIASAEVAVSHANSKEVKAASTSACPSDWYVADDPAEAVRYFVIQVGGSMAVEGGREEQGMDVTAAADGGTGAVGLQEGCCTPLREHRALAAGRAHATIATTLQQQQQGNHLRVSSAAPCCSSSDYFAMAPTASHWCHC
jgi:hypothetical protein